MKFFRISLLFVFASLFVLQALGVGITGTIVGTVTDKTSAVVAGASASEIESTKSVSDVYVPVSGEVHAVNEALVDTPELVNSDPYGLGWILEVSLADASELENLLDADAYRAFVEAS